MARDGRGETEARRTALRGGLVGLALAAALLAPSLLSGGVPARGDLADFFWPMKAYGAERWLLDAHPPLWNPLSGAGEPWLAQLQSGVLYPGDLPFLAGWREGALLGIALHLALAAAGAAFCLWELGASRPASLLAGGLYAGGGAFLSLVPVYNNACTAAWLPWLFPLARRVVLGRSRGAGLAVAVAGAFLAGEPALAAAGTAAAVLLALFAGAEGEPSGREPSRRGRALPLVLPILVAVALAGAALLPFVELVAGAGRRATVTLAEAVARPVGRSDLADLVAPPRPDVTRRVAEGRGGYLLSLALGPLPLLLAAGAGAGLPGRRRFLSGLLVVAAAGLLLALGAAGFVAPLLFDLGPLRGIRYPARWFVFPHLALALAAGAGLDGWLWGRFRRAEGLADPDGTEGAESRARHRAAHAGLAVGLLVLAVPAALATLAPEARAARDRTRTLAGGAAALLGVGALVLGRRREGVATGAPAAFVAGLALVPLPFVAGEPLAPASASAVAAPSPAVTDLRLGPEAGRVFAPAGQDRSLATRWRYVDGGGWSEASVSRASAALAGYTNLFHGIASAGSASPIGNPRTERLLGAALAGGDPARLLALLDVRHVVTPFPTRAPGLRPSVERAGVRRYDVAEPFGRAFFPLESREATDDEAFEALRGNGFDPGRTALVSPEPGAAPLPPPRPSGSWAAARFLADGAERAEVATSASKASLLVLTRSWDPGWVARVDGERTPTRRAQLGLLAVVVPPGEHRLELLYSPASFRVGLGLSGAGVLALLALALAGDPGGRR